MKRQDRRFFDENSLAYSTCAKILRLRIEIADPESVLRSAREEPNLLLQVQIPGDDNNYYMARDVEAGISLEQWLR